MAPVRTVQARHRAVARRTASQTTKKEPPAHKKITAPISRVKAPTDDGTARVAAAPAVILDGSASTSNVSWLLLAIGLGLVVLVIWQTTLLGLAEPELGLAQARERQPDPEPEPEPLPIRHVQLKR